MNIKKQIHIFIVDDNKTFALTLKGAIELAFKKLRIKVTLFETGESCIQPLRKITPALVILDYNLNSISAEAADGLEILDEIKKQSSNISVIMLTNNDHINTALTSFRRGAYDYIIKTENPFQKISHSIARLFADKQLTYQNTKKAKKAVELKIANKEFHFQKENQLRTEELISVTHQKSEAERSKLIVEEKNKSITDSLNYAKRIQQAKLPKQEEIYASLTRSFILFKPKDIVSGDFYFFHKTSPYIFIAAADCTGHGVPGAFMSMICLEKLNATITSTSDLSQILQHLNKGIKKSLRQSESDEAPRDGMDIAICSINTQDRIVEYAGANRPLWIIRKGSLTVNEIKATKKAIGGFTEDDQLFDTHAIQLRKDDTFYIFSDGYADTFGGMHGKKLMTKKFKEILLGIQDLSMPDQKLYLDNFIENWKGGAEQVDDILVIGVRL